MAKKIASTQHRPARGCLMGVLGGLTIWATLLIAMIIWVATQ